MLEDYINLQSHVKRALLLSFSSGAQSHIILHLLLPCVSNRGQSLLMGLNKPTQLFAVQISQT